MPQLDRNPKSLSATHPIGQHRSAIDQLRTPHQSLQTQLASKGNGLGARVDDTQHGNRPVGLVEIQQPINVFEYLLKEVCPRISPHRLRSKLSIEIWLP